MSAQPWAGPRLGTEGAPFGPGDQPLYDGMTVPNHVAAAHRLGFPILDRAGGGRQLIARRHGKGQG